MIEYILEEKERWGLLSTKPKGLLQISKKLTRHSRKMFLRERGHLSLQEKGALIGLAQSGLSKREIAEILHCHPNTVKKWIKRYEETLDVTRRVGSGRPSSTTAAEDQMLLDAVRSKPITTAQEIAGNYDK